MLSINMETCDRITQIYERQANECLSAINRFFDDTSALATKTGFAPMVDFCNQIYEFYNGDLKSHLFREFDNWYNGEHSFHSLMRAINAGTAAESEARLRMDDMRSSLEGMFRMSSGTIHPDTSQPKLKDSDYEIFESNLGAAKACFDRATSDASSSINGMASENQVVSLIGPIVKSTGASLKESFEKFQKEVLAGYEFANRGKNKTIQGMPGTASLADVHVAWGKGVPFM